MTKQVLITLYGLQTEGGTALDEPIEITTPGTYKFDGAMHEVRFQEKNDPELPPTENIFRMSRDRVEVHKEGFLNADMVFVPGVRSASIYQTSFGEMRAELMTTTLDFNESLDQINVKLEYGLSLDGGIPYDCEIRVDVISLKQ